MNQTTETLAPSTGHPNKGFGTGKGTTAAIRTFFEDRNETYSAAEIAESIEVPARQINKRLNELVKSGFLSVSVTRQKGRQGYYRMADARTGW